MTKLALVLVSVCHVYSVLAASFTSRDIFIVDSDLKLSLCRAEGVYDFPLKQEDLIRALCEGAMEYRLKGMSFADYGAKTIYHYEIKKPGFKPCKVVKYWVPPNREVILASSDPYMIGEFRMGEGHWDWKALLPEGQGACFQ